MTDYAPQPKTQQHENFLGPGLKNNTNRIKMSKQRTATVLLLSVLSWARASNGVDTNETIVAQRRGAEWETRELQLRSPGPPRRRPINELDTRKRAFAIPPDPDGKKKMTAASASVQQPFYPSWDIGTCTNDHKYPEYYLYDINSYFFQNPKDCCEKHFGKNARECLSAAIAASGSEGSASMIKKAKYRSDSGGRDDGGRGGNHKDDRRYRSPAGGKKPLVKTPTNKKPPSSKGDKISGQKKPKQSKPPPRDNEEKETQKPKRKESKVKKDEPSDGKTGKKLPGSNTPNGKTRKEGTGGRTNGKAKNGKPNREKNGEKNQKEANRKQNKRGGKRTRNHWNKWNHDDDYDDDDYYYDDDDDGWNHSKGGKSAPSDHSKSAKHSKSHGWSSWNSNDSKSGKSSKSGKGGKGSKAASKGGKGSKMTDEPTYYPTGIPTSIPTTWFPTTFPTITSLNTTVPTSANTTMPTYGNFTNMPTSANATNIPTYSPTSEGSSTMPTYSPTFISTTAIPTFSPTLQGTTTATTPTISPTATQVTSVPTFSPTLTPETYTPTSSPTSTTYTPTTSPTELELPTMSPTTFSTLQPPLDLFVWGAPESSGQRGTEENILSPLPTSERAISASGGSRYSIIVGADGVASSAGFIESMDDYDGHLGLRPQDISEGQNDFQVISRVFDEDNGGVTEAPPFDKAFAGVEQSGRSRETHSILLDRQGRAWSFGGNSRGQLCLSDEIDRLIPERIPIEVRIVDVAIGGAHTLLLDEDGNVHGCGSNEFGQLGLGNDVNQITSPAWLEILPKIDSISAGRDHSLFKGRNGLFVTGSNEYGQLCVDTGGKNMMSLSALELAVQPSRIAHFEATKFSSYIAYNDGSVNSCGKNDFGQLGNGSNENEFFATVQLDGVVQLLGMGPSAESAFFVTSDDVVWGTGLNDRGQLGVGDLNNRNLPEILDFGQVAELEVLSSAEDHTIALGIVVGSFTPTASPTSISTTFSPTTAPTITPTTYSPTREMKDFFFWGAPDSVGQESPDVTQPLNVGGDVIGIAAGSRYTVIILQDGSALSAGFVQSRNDYHGHLGLSSSQVARGINEFQPVSEVYNAEQDAITDPPAFDKAYAGVESTTDSGVIHTILIDRQGRAWATGSNSMGQLCLGDKEDRMIPEQIPINSLIVDVAIGSEHTLLLDEDGNVYGCGSNVDGQLGLGGENDVNIPTQLELIGVTSLSSGSHHSLFMAEDGIYVTGSNEFSQLCADTNGDSILLPIVLDFDLSTVQSVQAIKFSSFILNIDGSVNSCGKNEFGELGDGSGADQTITTVQLDRVVRLLGSGPSSESQFFATVDEDGNEYVWGTGLNDRGQLGTGDLENRDIPDRVRFDTMVIVDVISAAEGHTIALGISAGTLSPTFAATSMVPTLSPTELSSTSKPTVSPTFLTSFPTNAPTESLTTNRPTTPWPTLEARQSFYWGASDSVGIESSDKTEPVLALDAAVDTSAGSKYSFFVLQDGTALSAGLIENSSRYRGHLGLVLPDGFVGIVESRSISEVYNTEQAAYIDPPSFDKVYAGVESAPDSGIIHTILLDRQGRAWATGSNSMGQLCLGDNEDRMIPELIPIDGRIADVAIGSEHTLLLDENGNVYGCSDHSLFLSEDGIYVTGSNEYSQLCSEGGNFDTPNKIDIDIGNILQFEAMKFSSFILYVDGSVNSCGKNEFGELGDGSNTDQILATVQLDSVVRLIASGPSAESAFFVTEDEDGYERLWGTGLNDRGQLGTGDLINKNIPERVSFDSIVVVDVLSAAQDHTIALGISTGTFAPTIAPTMVTIPPTTYVPVCEETDFFFWGAPDSVGEISSVDATRPLQLDGNVTYTSAGYQYSLVVLDDGTAVSAGFIESIDEYSGNLGLDLDLITEGTNEFRPIDQVYDNASGEYIPSPRFDKVFAGVNGHTILLDRQGRAWASGNNEAGQLCLGDNIDRYIPERIPIDIPIVDIAIGSHHTLLLDGMGIVHGCGSNENGQLGLGNLGTEFPYVNSPSDIVGLESVSKVSAGEIHSLFTTSGGLYVSGGNQLLQLCLDLSTDIIRTPEKLDVDLNSVKLFQAIRYSSYILFTDGTVTSCGSNEFGELGDGSNVDKIFANVALNNVVDLFGVGPSARSAFFVSDDGSVWATGRNDRGQLGTGDLDDRNTPSQVRFGGDVNLCVLSTSEDHTLAVGSLFVVPTSPPTQSPSEASTASSTVKILTETPTEVPTPSPTINSETGTPTLISSLPTTYPPTPVTFTTELYYWGAPESFGLISDSNEVSVPLNAGDIVLDVAAGSKYSIVLLPDGSAQAGGFINSIDDYHGHLGLLNTNISPGDNPFQVISEVFDSENNVVVRQVWATGSNEKGQLCVSDFDDRLIPTKIPLSDRIVHAAIGGEHTLLLSENGVVYACGSNELGQIGLGSGVTATSEPVVIDSLSTVRSISAGLGFSLFITSDGLHVTGNNFYGQLCVDTGSSDVFTPELLDDVDGQIVASFEAIQSSSYILFNDGSVGACGRNNFGQLGDGTNDDKVRTVASIPAPIRRLGVGPSSESAFFVDDNGVVYGTGLNDRGQLGVGDLANRNVLTIVSFAQNTTVEQLSAAGDHTLSR
ncbi:hypothetical protein ACHAXS_009292 [Conticribra weissflogii]